MTGKQIALVAVTLIIVSVLFYLGYKTPYGTKPEGETIAASTFNFRSFLEESKIRLPANLKGRINGLENQNNNEEDLLSLSRIWDSLRIPFISAHYAFEVARLQPNEDNWQFAGTKFYTAASFSNDSVMQVAAAQKAITAFENVLSLDSLNLDAKNALAILYIQINKDIMKGVGMLKQVVSRDSNNLQAIFTLGMLSIQSGQLDKAEQRFSKLIALQPFNPDYYYYLAEVYGKQGLKDKAIKTYETCKSLLKDKKAKEEIEVLINQLKNT